MLRHIWSRFAPRLLWQFAAFFTVATIVDLFIYLSGHQPSDFLGLIAIEFAAITLYLDFRLHRATEQIASAATTRYLAQWPSHLADLRSLISRAHADDEIWILLDFLGHGLFTNPTAYKAYFKELREAVDRGSTVRILLCAEEDARLCHEIQFDPHFKRPGKPDSLDFLQSDEVKKWLEEYRTILRGYKPGNRDDLIDTLQFLNDHFCHQLLVSGGNVAIRTLPILAEGKKDASEAKDTWMKAVIYSWIVRDKEMIFSFPKFYGPRNGHSFQTHDGRLIESFQKQFDERWNDRTTPIKDHVYGTSFAKISDAIDHAASAAAHG